MIKLSPYKPKKYEKEAFTKSLKSCQANRIFKNHHLWDQASLLEGRLRIYQKWPKSLHPSQRKYMIKEGKRRV
jgi:hypothetical protein